MTREHIYVYPLLFIFLCAPHPILIRIYIKSSSKRCLELCAGEGLKVTLNGGESKGGLSLDSYPLLIAPLVLQATPICLEVHSWVYTQSCFPSFKT